MYRNKRIAAVVPAYNEELHVGKVLEGMPDFVDAVYVVDDCSTDRTAEIVRGYIQGVPQAVASSLSESDQCRTQNAELRTPALGAGELRTQNAERRLRPAEPRPQAGEPRRVPAARRGGIHPARHGMDSGTNWNVRRDN